MAAPEQIDSGTGLYEQQKLGRLLDGGKIGQRLLDAIIENVKIRAMQPAYEASLRVSYDYTDVHAVDANADGLRWGQGRLL